jgi:hypothetical protein
MRTNSAKYFKPLIRESVPDGRGTVVEEGDSDLMGDNGVNIAARVEGISKPAAACLSE